MEVSHDVVTKRLSSSVSFWLIGLIFHTCFFFLSAGSDKRTDSWPLVYSPVPISCIFLCYLLVIWLGPKVMAGREAINLRAVLIVYNFLMVGLSSYMFYEVP